MFGTSTNSNPPNRHNTLIPHRNSKPVGTNRLHNLLFRTRKEFGVISRTATKSTMIKSLRALWNVSHWAFFLSMLFNLVGGQCVVCVPKMSGVCRRNCTRQIVNLVACFQDPGHRSIYWPDHCILVDPLLTFPFGEGSAQQRLTEAMKRQASTA